MLYICSATFEKKGDWNHSGQVPTFILDSRIQGIKNEAHAEFIATEIINPLRDKKIIVRVRPVASDEEVYFAKPLER